MHDLRVGDLVKHTEPGVGQPHGVGLIVEKKESTFIPVTWIVLFPEGKWYGTDRNLEVISESR